MLPVCWGWMDMSPHIPLHIRQHRYIDTCFDQFYYLTSFALACFCIKQCTRVEVGACRLPLSILLQFYCRLLWRCQVQWQGHYRECGWAYQVVEQVCLMNLSIHGIVDWWVMSLRLSSKIFPSTSSNSGGMVACHTAMSSQKRIQEARALARQARTRA